MEQEHRDLFDLGLQADVAMMQQSLLTRRRLLKLGLVGITSFLAGCTPFAGQSSTPTGVPTATPAAGSGSVPSPTALPASPTALPASPTVATTRKHACHGSHANLQPRLPNVFHQFQPRLRAPSLGMAHREPASMCWPDPVLYARTFGQASAPVTLPPAFRCVWS
ncbi:MAG: hypothetical protein KatS3mg056_3751 [Chloroflexus sp.]|nr:MAG: hypothetical protein KatS3mg056_3751 [Chloroflexus sp.]